MPAPRPEIVDLASVPSLGGIYARQVGPAVIGAVTGAVAGVVRRVLPHGGGHPASVGALPDVAYRASGITVDPQRQAAFTRLVHGTVSDRLHPGFVHALAFPVAMALLARDDFPLPLAGLVHLANRWEQTRPLTTTGSLTVTVVAEDLRPHRSGTLVDVVAVIEDRDGPAATDRSTYLARGRWLTGTVPPRDGEREPFRPPVPTGMWRLPKDTGRRFAAVSGDWNPIHVSGPSARLLSMRGAIAHGMDTASRGLATVRLPEAFSWEVAFAAPVVLPATVAVRVDGRPEDDGGVRLTGWNPRSGKLHLTATVAAR